MHKAQFLARRAFLETGRIFALAIFCVIGAMLLHGCSTTKIEYEKTDKGEVSYRLYRNDHWLKRDSTGLRGGMTDAGKFEFSADGITSSPSEEFNRTMQTYTTAFVQLAQIAAAAYNPASTGLSGKSGDSGNSGSSGTTTAATTAAATTAATTASTTNTTNCVDCVAK